MNVNKAWMYSRLENVFISEEYMNGVEEFVNFTKRHPECIDVDKLRCPCNQRKCRNTTFRDEDIVKVHLGKYGFVQNYYNCTFTESLISLRRLDIIFTRLQLTLLKMIHLMASQWSR